MKRHRRPSGIEALSPSAWIGVLVLVLVGGATGPLLAQVVGETGSGALPPINKGIDLPEPANDPKAVEVIERYIDAIGGKELLDAIKDKTVTFETIKHAPAGETTAKLKLFLKRDFKIREEWDLPGFQISDKPLKFVQVYNGFDGWVQMFGTISPLEGRTLSIFVWDKPIDDFFLHWKENGYSITYVNADTLDGEPVDVIQTSDFHARSKIRYVFSQKTGLLLKKEWRDEDPKGLIQKSNHYLNYRKIPFTDDPAKGVHVALHQKIFTRDNLDTERKFIEISFNSGLRDAIFERPPGELFKGGIGGSKAPGAQFIERSLGGGSGSSSTAPTAETPPQGSGPRSGTAPRTPQPVPVPVPTTRHPRPGGGKTPQ